MGVVSGVLVRTGAIVGDGLGTFCSVLVGEADKDEVATGVGLEAAGLAQDENKTTQNSIMVEIALTRLTNIKHPS